MALTISNRGSSWTTTAGNKSVTWVAPTAGHMVVVVAGCTGTGAQAVTNVSDNNGDSATYTKVVQAIGGGTGGVLTAWVRNKAITNTTDTIFTATISGDTGGGLWVAGIAGALRVGTQFIVQTKNEDTQTESPPTITFNAACGTGNGGIIAVLGEDNPPTLTAPTSWPESIDTGYATPTTGICINTRNSTAGDQAIAWSAGALIDHCEIGVELDATAAPALVQFIMTNAYRISHDGLVQEIQNRGDDPRFGQGGFDNPLMLSRILPKWSIPAGALFLQALDATSTFTADLVTQFSQAVIAFINYARKGILNVPFASSMTSFSVSKQNQEEGPRLDWPMDWWTVPRVRDPVTLAATSVFDAVLNTAMLLKRTLAATSTFLASLIAVFIPAGPPAEAGIVVRMHRVLNKYKDQ